MAPRLRGTILRIVRDSYRGWTLPPERKKEGVRYNSSNLVLRDVEWFTRGFQGGSLFTDLEDFGDPTDLSPSSIDKWNDFFNMIVPVSSTVVDLIKLTFGKDALNLNDPNVAKATEAGGSATASDGWLEGRDPSISLEQALINQFGGPNIILPGPLQLNSLPQLQSPQGDPFEPIAKLTFESVYFENGILQTSSIFYEEGLAAGELYSFDPVLDDFFTVFANDFITNLQIDITSGATSMFSMILGDSVFDVFSGEVIDILALTNGGGAKGIIFELGDKSLIGQDFLLDLAVRAWPGGDGVSAGRG